VAGIVCYSLDYVKLLVFTISMRKAMKPHHHGNLKPALVDAGIALLAEGGHSALTLRQCAARAGVSHAAPAHHFNGLKGLLTAIVTQGFKAFTLAMINERDVAANDPDARLIAVCNGYLSFARNNEAMANLMFMTNEIFTDDPEYEAASTAAYQVLADACEPFATDAAAQRRTEVLIWSLVQGYATLQRSGLVDAGAVAFADVLSLIRLRVVGMG